MRLATIDRVLLASGYALLALGCVAWWAIGPSASDKTPLSSLIALWLAAGGGQIATDNPRLGA